VPILAKRKSESKTRLSYKEPEAPLILKVHQIAMADYEAHHTDKRKLKELATPVCDIEARHDVDLEQMRKRIERTRPPMSSPPTAATQTMAVGASAAGKGVSPSSSASDFTFIDSVTAVRFFRIDRAQESLHYVIDICDECGLYIVHDHDNDEGERGTLSQNGAETVFSL